LRVEGLGFRVEGFGLRVEVVSKLQLENALEGVV